MSQNYKTPKRKHRRKKSFARRLLFTLRNVVLIVAAAVLIFKFADHILDHSKKISGISGYSHDSSFFPVKHISNDENIPQSLLDLYERNPETYDFVQNYRYEDEISYGPDLTDITQGSLPHLLQWDERWGYQHYGDDFLAVTGCGPTSLSIVYSGLTGNTDGSPLNIARFSERNGYYSNGVGTSWSLMDEGASALGLTVHNVTFDKEHILDALRNDHPIICSMRPGDFTTTGHYIVLESVDEAGNIHLIDPNSPDRTDRTWTLDELMPQIKNLWGYSYGEYGTYTIETAEVSLSR